MKHDKIFQELLAGKKCDKNYSDEQKTFLKKCIDSGITAAQIVSNKDVMRTIFKGRTRCGLTRRYERMKQYGE